MDISLVSALPRGSNPVNNTSSNMRPLIGLKEKRCMIQKKNPIKLRKCKAKGNEDMVLLISSQHLNI